MKHKMKRVLLILCMVACFFTLSACSKASEGTEEIEPQIVTALEDLGKQQLLAFTQLTPEDIESYKKEFEKTKNTVMVTAMDSWKSSVDDMGAFVSMDSQDVSLVDGDYLLTIHATFEKHPVVFTMMTDYEGMITNMSFNVVYTLGEKLEQALMNMIMGMGTVFIVLIFISWLISCFKYINNWEKKMKEQAAAKEPVFVPAPAPAAPAVPAPAPAAPAPAPIQEPEPEEDLTDDFELAAVIAAAIAASENVPVEGLVVRSIRRKSSGKWKNA